MRVSFLSELLTATVFLGLAGAVVVTHPNTPLPDAWNPTKPLLVSDPRTPLTRFKARIAQGSIEKCIAALDQSELSSMPPLEESSECGVRDRVRLERAGGMSMAPVETTCAVALRLALWERHDLQEAAKRLLGAQVDRLEHLSSYSCRRIRTSGGEGDRMSTHASARAIDVTGFRLSDGREVQLLEDWGRRDNVDTFLRAAQASACDWFGGVLGPDFNALHADHFHMQLHGGFCR